MAVDTPAYKGRNVEFVAELEGLSVDADRLAKIAVNERTGTIVVGKDVKFAPVPILHGRLTVEIQTTLAVSQTEALSSGKAAVTPQVTVKAKEEKARNVVLKQRASVEELVQALVAIGSTPRDIIAILQKRKASGALEAELEVL